MDAFLERILTINLIFSTAVFFRNVLFSPLPAKMGARPIPEGSLPARPCER